MCAVPSNLMVLRRERAYSKSTLPSFEMPVVGIVATGTVFPNAKGVCIYVYVCRHVYYLYVFIHATDFNIRI